MKKTLTFAFAAIMTLSFASLALADVRPVKKHLVKKQFDLGHKAIQVAGIKVTKTIPEKVIKGRKVKVMQTKWKLQRVVDRFTDMLRTGEKINGGRVVGMAYQNHSKSWNITVRKDDQITIINLKSMPKGTDMVIRGALKAPIKKAPIKKVDD